MSESEPIEPFENGDTDRDTGGRFRPGCKGGPGSPVARRAREIRERLDDALYKTCAPDRLLTAVDAILKLAEAGDVQAFKLLAERIAGPPVARDVLERLEALEATIGQRESERVKPQDRLTRLEQAIGKNCPACHGEQRVVAVFDGDLRPTNTTCPTCGRDNLTLIIVEYYDVATIGREVSQ